MARQRNHGISKYRYDKCRCDVCKKAYSDMNRKHRILRKERKARGEIEIKHGTYGYTDGCRCKTCSDAARSARTKRLYGDTVTKRPDSCEMCDRAKPLFMDHDHESGDFRGWLCTSCNTGRGKLGDSIAGLESALAYLKSRP